MKKMITLIYSPRELTEELQGLITTLAEEFPLRERGRGTRVTFRKVDSEGFVSRVIQEKPGTICIEYSSITAAARGIGSALAGLKGEETTSFRTLGIMIDLSRNLVMKPSYFKYWFRRLALAGYNSLWLYTEDVYQLPGEPLFGYQRGGYSLEDLQDLDRFARKLGIELSGCIQTLGHMEQFLKWKNARTVKDTDTVMLVDEPATYQLIEKMLTFWDKALSSRRIHIGLDETHDLGRGRFMDIHGYEPPLTILNRHLGKVNEMCAAHGFTPMIWSDMYFRLSNPDQNYYDLTSPIPDEIRESIPKNVRMVYWDYENTDPAVYAGMIRRHYDLGFKPIMGSGIQTWMRFWFDHEQTCRMFLPALEACKQEKVDEFYFTMWSDDGAYCNYSSTLADMYFCADLIYGGDGKKRAAARFDAICQSDYAAHMAVSVMSNDLPKIDLWNGGLLWDDPLLGILYDDYDRRCPGFAKELIARYKKIIRKAAPLAGTGKAGDFAHICNLLRVLVLKLELRQKLLAAYSTGNRAQLRRIANQSIPPLIEAVRAFDESFRVQWMACGRPYGLERVQGRNALVIARLNEVARRIGEYLAGDISAIEELESRMDADGPVDLTFQRYRRVSSAAAWN